MFAILPLFFILAAEHLKKNISYNKFSVICYILKCNPVYIRLRF